MCVCVCIFKRSSFDRFILLYNIAVCNRYRMVGSVLWIIKLTTPRAQPKGEGLYVIVIARGQGFMAVN